MARRKLEKDLEKACVDYAAEHGFVSVKLDKAARSWPDRLFLGPSSQMLLVEFKRPGEKPRKQQEVRHRKLAALGHPVSVIFSLDAFCELLSCAAVLGESRQP
jgi:hypothetical protein